MMDRLGSEFRAVGAIWGPGGGGAGGLHGNGKKYYKNHLRKRKYKAKNKKEEVGKRDSFL